MLLIFLAGLTAQFRFVSTVTILQQTVRCRRRDVVRRGATARKAKGESRACRLLKGWASAGAFSLLTSNSKLAQY
jgi:poly(3-hydroxyalkanoate) synthetase